jgi:hypothetical protein
VVGVPFTFNGNALLVGIDPAMGDITDGSMSSDR